jgi:hypothetical protein
VDTEGTHRVSPRAWLAPVSLIVAPVLGVMAGGSMPNPPGNGPGAGQVAVGIAVPVCIALAVSAAARVRALEACVWALLSLTLTGGLVLALMYFVEYAIRPA